MNLQRNCLICGQPATIRDLCRQHYEQAFLHNDRLKLLERQAAAKVKVFRKLRETMTDGELADQIIAAYLPHSDIEMPDFDSLPEDNSPQ